MHVHVPHPTPCQQQPPTDLCWELVAAAQLLKAHHIVDRLFVLHQRQRRQHPDLEPLREEGALLRVDLECGWGVDG